MHSGEEATRDVRLQEFFKRLVALTGAQNSLEARQQIEQTLNQVEDELTSIPRQPSNWQTDGRMYPPQEDAVREVAGFPGVLRMRSRGHNTFIGLNGAIEIRKSGYPPELGELLVSKPGADGKGVWPT